MPCPCEDVEILLVAPLKEPVLHHFLIFLARTCFPDQGITSPDTVLCLCTHWCCHGRVSPTTQSKKQPRIVNVCSFWGERGPLAREKKISAKVAIERSTLAAKWMLNSYLTRYQKSENTRLEKNIFSSLCRPYCLFVCLLV